ncbi:hypothetical protein ACHAP5_006709 [Fusarium lateritium]
MSSLRLIGDLPKATFTQCRLVYEDEISVVATKDQLVAHFEKSRFRGTILYWSPNQPQQADVREC